MEDADIASTLQKERDAEAPPSSSQSRSRSQQLSPQASLMEAAAMVLELHVDLPTTQGNINHALLQVVQSERDQPEPFNQEDQEEKANEEQGSTEVPATSNKEELVQDQQIEGMIQNKPKKPINLTQFRYLNGLILNLFKML